MTDGDQKVVDMCVLNCARNHLVLCGGAEHKGQGQEQDAAGNGDPGRLNLFFCPD